MQKEKGQLNSINSSHRKDVSVQRRHRNRGRQSENGKKILSSQTKKNTKEKSQNRWIFNKKKERSKKKEVRTAERKGLLHLSMIIGGALLVSIVSSFFFFKMVSMDGSSMAPTLQNKDVVMVRRTKNLNRFDLVLFQRGKTQQIRRVIGLPGERVEYKDDFLLINGEPIDEKYIIDKINDAQRKDRQFTLDFRLEDIAETSIIPKNCYLVLGDNRDYGYDSRDYGVITDDQIKGVVCLRLLPLKELSLL